MLSETIGIFMNYSLYIFVGSNGNSLVVDEEDESFPDTLMKEICPILLISIKDSSIVWKLKNLLLYI